MAGKTNSNTQIVYEGIKRYIVDMRLMPGTPLVETELAKHFEVSRTPIREAMKLLDADGLVEITLNKGARIKRFTERELGQCFEVAEALEGAIAKDICERKINGVLSDGYLQSLHDILEEMDEALAKGDFHTWANGDQRFHQQFYQVCENPYFNKLLSTVYIQLNSVLWYLTLALLDKSVSQAEHWQIYNAILSGTPEEARQLSQRHRERVRRFLINMKRPFE